MKSTILAAALLVMFAAPLKAQTISAGLYGGVTTPTPSTFTGMVMADFGTTFNLEPWAQSFGKEVQVGTDLIVSPRVLRGFGATVGAYSNTSTQRAGITFTHGNGQLRILKATGGLWQGIGYYNFNLPKRNYLQVWAAPAQGGSSWLLGVGHTFKE